MNFFSKHFKKNSEYDNGYYPEDYYGEEENTVEYADEDGYEDGVYEDDTVVDGAAFEMKLITPKDYSDREEIARCLVNGNAVFLNIEALDRPSIIRLMDYLSGVIYVIQGNVKWSNSSSVIFAPKNVSISGIDEPAETVEEVEEEVASDDDSSSENYYD